VLKQRLRDHIDPDRDLGHSDKHGKKKEAKTEGKSEEKEKSEDKGEKIDKTVENVGSGPTKSEESAEGADIKRNPDGTVCEDCN
jgi:hypothetical protein